DPFRLGPRDRDRSILFDALEPELSFALGELGGLFDAGLGQRDRARAAGLGLGAVELEQLPAFLLRGLEQLDAIAFVELLGAEFVGGLFLFLLARKLGFLLLDLGAGEAGDVDGLWNEDRVKRRPRFSFQDLPLALPGS